MQSSFCVYYQLYNTQCYNDSHNNIMVIQCCIHFCGLQMSHVGLSFSFLQLSVSYRIISSQSSLLHRRPMFVLVSLFLVCLPVFLQSSIVASRVSRCPDVFVIMCPAVFRLFNIVVSFTQIVRSTEELILWSIALEKVQVSHPYDTTENT